MVNKSSGVFGGSAILLVLLAFIAAENLFFSMSFSPIQQPDSNSYIVTAKNFLENHNFDKSPRLPGYPLFLAVNYKLFGTSNKSVVISQHIMGILVLLMFLKMLKTNMQRIIFSCFYFTDVMYNSYQHVILADFFLSFFLCLTAYCLWLYMEKKKLVYIALAGFSVGVAVLTKLVMRLFPFIAAALILSGKQSFKQKILATGVFFIFPVLGFVLGQGSVPLESGRYVGKVGNFIEFPEDGIVKEIYLKLLKHKSSSRSSVAMGVMRELKSKGWRELEINKQFEKIVKLSIYRHPVKYVGESCREIFYFFFSAHNLYAKEYFKKNIPFSVSEAVKNKRWGRVFLKIVVSGHLFYWMIFFSLVYFIAVYTKPIFSERNLCLLYQLAIIVYITLISCFFNQGLARYRCAIQPFMLFMASYSVAHLINKTRKANKS